jgi:hypothetical protein
MGTIVRFPHHAMASVDDRAGLGTSDGQGASGQLSENQRRAPSSRRTCMSAPPASAPSFLPSSKARELTVVSSICSIAAYSRATMRSCSIPVMDAISVNLPGKSTAILPDAQIVDSGQITGMNLTVLLRNIENRLTVLDISADAASRKAGRPDAIRNLRRAVREGKGGMTIQTLAALAKALETTQEDLTRPPDPVPPVNRGDTAKLRDILLAQRDLITRQIQALDADEAAAPTTRKRRAR